VKDYEKKLILEAPEKTNWVKARAARLLHINRTILVEKIKSKNLAETGSG
jgi:DNA-binding NtrC family response regulator